MTFLSMGEVDRPCGACPRREVTFFVELPIVGEIALRHHAEYAATMDDDCAVVQSVAAAQRSTDHDHGKHIGGGLAQGFDGFKGQVMHSAQWEADENGWQETVKDWDDKRVAVIGVVSNVK